MYVSARSDEYTGTFRTWQLDCVGTLTRTDKKTGAKTTSQDLWSIMDHRVTRYSHTKNADTTLSGSSTKWKPVSSYERHVVDIDWDKGVWITDTPTETQEYEGYPKTNGGDQMFNCVPCIQSVSGQWDTNIRNQTRTECLLKLADGKAELGAAIGEAKQTANMLADNWYVLLNGYMALKKGNWGYFGRKLKNLTAKDIANLRLELVYGFIPLMQDCEGAYSLLREKLAPAPIISATRTVSDSSTVSGSYNSPGWDSNGHAKRSHRTKVYATPDLSRARTANRAGLLNPLAIAWELTPWSFVLDWGLPIGNVLSALTATTGLTFVGGYDALHVEGEVTARMKPNGSTIESSPRQGKMRLAHYKRSKLTGFPKPVPYAKSPFSTSHVLNALALWTQAHKRW